MFRTGEIVKVRTGVDIWQPAKILGGQRPRQRGVGLDYAVEHASDYSWVGQHDIKHWRQLPRVNGQVQEICELQKALPQVMESLQDAMQNLLPTMPYKLCEEQRIESLNQMIQLYPDVVIRESLTTFIEEPGWVVDRHYDDGTREEICRSLGVNKAVRHFVETYFKMSSEAYWQQQGISSLLMHDQM